MSFIEVYIVVVLHLMAWPALRYWMVYRRVRWQTGATGKALFNKARSLALLLAVLVIGFWYPFPGYDYVKGFCFTYLAGAVWYQYRVMRRLVKHRQEREAILAHYTLEAERQDDEASTPVRPDHP